MAIIAKLGADNSEYNAKLKESGKHTEALGEQVKELAKKFLEFEAAKKAAEFLKEFVLGGMEAIDMNAKLARQLGTTYDGLRAAQIAASEAGVSNETLSTALQRLNVSLGQAQAGSETAQKGFTALGLSAANIAHLDADTRLAAIADRVREMGLSASQTAAILKDFGIRGGELVDVLRQGGDKFREGSKAVEDFGLHLSEIDTMQVERAHDAMERIHLVMEGVRNQVVVQLAPYIEALSKKFTDLAKAHGGWGKTAVTAVEGVTTAVAYLGDGVRVLELIWQGMKVAALGAVNVITSAFELLFTAVASALQGAVVLINNFIIAANALGAGITELPSITDTDFMRGIHEFGSNMRDTLSDAEDQLQELAMTALPSDNIKKFFQEIKDSARDAAKEDIGHLNKQDGEGIAGVDPATQKKADAEYEAYLAHLRSRINALRDSVLTEKQLEDKKYQQKLADLNAFGAEQVLSEQQKATLLEQLQIEHIKKLNDIEVKGLTQGQKFNEMVWHNKVKTLAGSLEQMTAGTEAQSKAMFEIHKAASLAQAVVSLPTAIIESFKNAGGYPWGIASAAAMAATGAVQIAAIASSHFNGSYSGAAGSPVVTTPATAAAAPAPAASAQQAGGLLTVEGISSDSFFSGKVVRELATKLSDFSRDGGTVRFA